MSVSSPALKTIHTLGFSKMNRSEPEPLHGTSDSLHVPVVEDSGVRLACASTSLHVPVVQDSGVRVQGFATCLRCTIMLGFRV